MTLRATKHKGKHLFQRVFRKVLFSPFLSALTPNKFILAGYLHANRSTTTPGNKNP